ncbi:DUF4429 domain-containing protein [Crossiella sp. SN42]|uniref:DUF4429 domain-containing protein n=1 Tax=Crossiella sp. SN42 TaxID=2944808 RepID=UPI00207D4D5F|nr:DUF4429 domain-containing protein [Crossiella sp. SN42]MCO1581313.1 DUF4429 domain-containing protein [Crossiella sp. SN42]
MTFGLELAGDNATWFFETGSIRIVYRGGLRASGLLKKLGERTVPDTAIAGVRLSDDRRSATLRLLLRPGACPFLEAAGGQLPDRGDPYRLVVPANNRALAEHYAGDIRGRVSLNPDADRPAPEFLLTAPAPPCRLVGYDSVVGFDGRTVLFEPVRDEAHPEKRAAGARTVPIERVLGLDWATPASGGGHLRLRTADAPHTTLSPKIDPHTVTFGFGAGVTAESLPFAAALLVAIQRGQADAPALPSTLAATTDEVVAAIRKLGELREAGLLTEAEFAAKKTELLGRL